MAEDWTYDKEDIIRVMSVRELGDLGHFILLANDDLADLCGDFLAKGDDIPIRIKARDGSIVIERRDPE